MSLSPSEEALVRDLIAQNAALLSLASSESTIISKLGATKTTLSALTAASSLADSDLMLVRQGVTDKSVTGSVLKTYSSSGIINSVVPIGLSGLWPGTTPPTGWIKRNGALLSRASYPLLYAMAAASGNIVAEAAWAANPGSFSVGDGSTTFRIPDGRGLTDKGYHDGSGTFTTNTTRALGSYEADDNKAHTHTYQAELEPTSMYISTEPGYKGRNTGTTGSSGGPETTVRNAVYMPIIRAY